MSVIFLAIYLFSSQISHQTRIIHAEVFFEKTKGPETYKVNMTFCANSNEEASTFTYISYDQSRTSLKDFSAVGYIVSTGENICPLKTERISSSFQNSSLTGYVEEYAVFSKFSDCAFFEAEFSLVTDSSIWGEHFIFSLPLGEDYPIDTLDITIRSEKPFSWRRGSESGKTTTNPDSIHELFLRITDIQPRNSPQNTDLFLASSFNEMGEIAGRCFNLFRGKLTPDEEVRRKALLVSRGHPPPEKAEKIFDWVCSSIEYTAQEWGWRGFYPNEPSQTLAQGKGDCKDKVSLLIAMLQAVGIKAWPALIATRNNPCISFDPPAVFFNHVIALVEVENETLFCDPSNPGSPFSALPFEDRGVNALVLFEDTYRLLKTPDSFADFYKRKISGFISGEGTAELTVSDSIGGIISAFYGQTIRASENSPAYSWFSSKMPGWRILGAWAYSNSPGIATIGARLFRRILSADTSYFHLPLLYIVPSSPEGIFTGGPVFYSIDLQIEKPNNMEIFLPFDYFFEDEYLEVRFSYKKKDDSLFVSHLFSIKKSTLNPEDLTDYQKNLSTLNILSRRPLVLTKKTFSTEN
ncbi:transglutaminase domain-containing protein [candidate division WOR-3 bacterium]|nr:transglutaminase domain-containing protein [candidate division WOR-3 bacterium]